MIYNMLGKTNLVISAVGLGGIPLQRLDREKAVETVRYALERGVNFIDTARGYTVSESYIGAALAGGTARGRGACHKSARRRTAGVCSKKWREA